MVSWCVCTYEFVSKDALQVLPLQHALRLNCRIASYTYNLHSLGSMAQAQDRPVMRGTGVCSAHSSARDLWSCSCKDCVPEVA